MRSLGEQMASYAAYHRDTRNKITHFFGVPIVVFSILVPMAWFRFMHADLPLSGATLFVLGVLLYYLRLDKVVALAQAPLSFFLLYLAERAAALPFRESATIFAATFVGGWIIQLVGHVFEGKRPALTDNVLQIFNAPLFLTVEVMFLLGFRKELREQLELGQSAA